MKQTAEFSIARESARVALKRNKPCGLLSRSAFQRVATHGAMSTSGGGRPSRDRSKPATYVRTIRDTESPRAIRSSLPRARLRLPPAKFVCFLNRASRRACRRPGIASASRDTRFATSSTIAHSRTRPRTLPPHPPTISTRRFEAGAAPPHAVLAARARSQREDSASGGSGRARSASRRARSASRGVSEGTTAGGGSSANDDEASWDGDDGGKDDEFVVRPDEADAPDDMETFEEELEREPLDPEVVKIEVDALKAESEVPIETLLATYGGAGAARLGGAAAAASDASESESDSDSDSDDDDD